MQKQFFSTKEIAMLALMVATCTVGRLMFQFIPNVQPMTAIFLLITLELGVLRGLIVNLLSIIITNLFLGMGVWTISQILSFSVIILVAGLFAKVAIFKRRLWLQILYSVFAGYFFGFVISIIDTKVYGLTNFWAYYLAGLPFDTAHAMGNGAFYLILAPVFKRLFKNYKSEAKRNDSF